MIVYFGSKPASYYKGLRIKADLGLHEQIAEEILRYPPRGAKVLDLGAGEGALSERLADFGYEVLAVDVNEKEFKSRVPFQRLDFNDHDAVDQFISSHAEHFDAVLGMEVIEHVEDQWSYVRMLLSLVKPNRLAVITTPNITSWMSRLFFLNSGRFPQFRDADLEYRHINPICPWRLTLILSQCGAEIIELKSAGTLPPIYSGGNRAITRLGVGVVSILFLPVYLLIRGMKTGWCVLAVGRKKVPAIQDGAGKAG